MFLDLSATKINTFSGDVCPFLDSRHKYCRAARPFSYKSPWSMPQISFLNLLLYLQCSFFFFCVEKIVRGWHILLCLSLEIRGYLAMFCLFPAWKRHICRCKRFLFLSLITKSDTPTILFKKPCCTHMFFFLPLCSKRNRLNEMVLCLCLKMMSVTWTCVSSLLAQNWYMSSAASSITTFKIATTFPQWPEWTIWSSLSLCVQIRFQSRRCSSLPLF